MSDDNREAGRIPRTVECDLTADLGSLMSICPGGYLSIVSLVFCS